jgi:hypothetical protein
VPHHLEVPRPWRLLRTAAWNLNEAAGLPLIAFLLGDWLAGRDVGLLSGLGAVLVATGVHKIRDGEVPRLLLISAAMLAVQTALALVTGQLWIYFLQIPIGKLVLSLLFARSAPTSQPMVARLATEVVALRHPSMHYPGLQRFFQRNTWLWAATFLVLAVAFAVFLFTEPIPMFIVLSTVVTVGLVTIGAGVSALWFFSVLRTLGLRLRFAPG